MQRPPYGLADAAHRWNSRGRIGRVSLRLTKGGGGGGKITCQRGGVRELTQYLGVER